MKPIAARTRLYAILGLALLVRLFTLGSYPLTDNTEARYAEIGRKILETGHWVMPQIQYGVPFWGKPPLSFWLTAISFKLFGVNEFAARLPSLLVTVGVCALVFVLGVERRGTDYALRACVVIATSALVFVCAGAVMTDPAMLLGTTLCMVAFWRALQGGSRWWGYLFFVGLAIGLLAKGPVATVLSILPIGLWALLTGRVRQALSAVPCFSGALLAAVLVVPWYWAAEVQSPGFLHYFIVGEHWQRFTVSGWKGDLYGSGHPYPRGMIWLYALLAALPWSLWLLGAMARRQSRFTREALRADAGWLIYLLCWIAVPMLFFTMARNILPTYVLPAMAAFGLLAAEAWESRQVGASSDKLALLGLITPVLAVLLIVAVWPRFGFASQQEIVAAYAQRDPSHRLALVYLRQRPASAEFYSHGTAGLTDDMPHLGQYLAQPQEKYLATERATFTGLPDELRAQLRIVQTSGNGKYLLLHQDRSSPVTVH